MKKVKFIYNPVSGNGILRTKLDEIVDKFQRCGYQIIPYKLTGKKDVINAFKNDDFSIYYAIVVAGGDGTIHEVINEMKNNKLNLPLGIIPSGTSNDFANYIGLPKNILSCIDIITKKTPQYVDLGQINDKYFINVVAGGILANIAHKTKKTLKNVIGMFAYYIKAIEEIPNIKAFDAKITIDKNVIEEKIMMFFVLNSSIAGGFIIAPEAKINDGKLDICIIKKCTFAEFGTLFIKLLKGEHINNEKLILIQSDNIKIECSPRVDTDIDGEPGKKFPLQIKVLPKSLMIFK